MPSEQHKVIPTDSLMQLRQRLDCLPKKSPERATQVTAIAELYGVSPSTVYRALNFIHKPHAAHRADHGKPRVLQQAELERYCELIAALKLRTTNKQGRQKRLTKQEIVGQHGSLFPCSETISGQETVPWLAQQS